MRGYDRVGTVIMSLVSITLTWVAALWGYLCMVPIQRRAVSNDANSLIAVSIVFLTFVFCVMLATAIEDFVRGQVRGEPVFGGGFRSVLVTGTFVLVGIVLGSFFMFIAYYTVG